MATLAELIEQVLDDYYTTETHLVALQITALVYENIKVLCTHCEANIGTKVEDLRLRVGVVEVLCPSCKNWTPGVLR